MCKNGIPILAHRGMRNNANMFFFRSPTASPRTRELAPLATEWVFVVQTVAACNFFCLCSIRPQNLFSTFNHSLPIRFQHGHRPPKMPNMLVLHTLENPAWEWKLLLLGKSILVLEHHVQVRIRSLPGLLIHFKPSSTNWSAIEIGVKSPFYLQSPQAPAPQAAMAAMATLPQPDAQIKVQEIGHSGPVTGFQIPDELMGLIQKSQSI